MQEVVFDDEIKVQRTRSFGRKTWKSARLSDLASNTEAYPDGKQNEAGLWGEIDVRSNRD